MIWSAHVPEDEDTHVIVALPLRRHVVVDICSVAADAHRPASFHARNISGLERAVAQLQYGALFLLACVIDADAPEELTRFGEREWESILSRIVLLRSHDPTSASQL